VPAHPLLAVLVPSFATGLATTAGALSLLMRELRSRRSYDTLLGLGAGLMLAAATLGLLSTALEAVRIDGRLDPAQLALVLLGFGAGVAVLYVMDRHIPHEHAGGHHVHVHVHEHDHDRAHGDPAEGDALRAAEAARHDEAHTARVQGLLVVGVMALHRLPEGLAIGAAYAAGGSTLGLTLVVAIGVQNFVEGMVMAAPLRRGGLRGDTLLLIVAATGMAVPCAALAGFYLSSLVAGALPPMLALAAGALIYLTCNEVIPESHSHGNEVRATFGVVAGFVVIMLVQAVLGRR
jgi:zinc transporter, ZIP family